ncbi:hypothetical protein Vafri_5326 [Volvox africanus]|uniref:Uncharacterized protein n=1 Tax=Volvox africanus TaxID=51714 RepID=A0A8J4AX70_9CHLO|nr:hypothetical protein Vafri_5326 [Volvox africanus]
MTRGGAMASSQGPQKTPSKSPIDIFGGLAWTIKWKRIKQGDLGEENRMYFHKELNRWVEIGKEEEAKQEAAGPPPPPILAVGAFTSKPLHKRNLSQRYVPQPDLSISSSMASLAGSLSQTDFAGHGNSFSGPPSTMGSIAPSPPQSGGGLILPVSFSQWSRPPSETACATTATTFVPSSPKRPIILPSAGTFFAPLPTLPSDSQVLCWSGELEGLVKVDEAAISAEVGDKQHSVPGSAAPQTHSNTGEVFNRRNDLELAAFTDMEMSECAGAQTRIDATNLTDDPRAPLSFPSTEERSVDSPMALVVPPPEGLVSEDQQQPPSPLASRGCFVGAAANASDIGAAISLHGDMGVTPVRSHVYHHNSGEGDRGATMTGGELAAVEEDDTTADSRGPPADFEAAGASDGQAAWPVSIRDSLVVEANDGGQAIEDKNGDAARAETTATGPSDGGAEGSGGSTWHSQYYYQQYAYLYQYAVGIGYGEADAVTYAQYYAATYAQQYEAQTPEGNIGGVVHTADAGVEQAASALDAQVQQQQEQLAVIGVAMDSTRTAAVPKVVETVAEPAWQAAAASDEDEATAVAGESSLLVEDVGRSEGPVYLTAPHVSYSSLHTAPLASGSFVPEPMVAAGDVGIVTAAPLPVDLTVAATAAAQHHQSALTAAAAAIEEQRRVSRPGAADGAGRALTSVAATDNATGQLAAALAPLGLGARGAKPLTHLSSVVASLGAIVEAADPVPAALSEATVAASTASAPVGGFVDMEGVVDLSEEGFDRIMHPGDPAKLDGPLPWELPEHLRTSRKFLALCANWQLRNPGQQYTPQVQQQTAEARMVTSQIPQQGVEMVVAMEDGSGFTGSAGPLVEADLSSYELACRFAQLGQPATGLTLINDAKRAVTVDSSLREPQQQQQQQQLINANGDVFVAATAPPCKPIQDAQEVSHDTSVPESASTAVVDTPLCLPHCFPVAMVIPNDRHPTPDFTRSDDPFVGIEPAPISQPLLQEHSWQASLFHVPNSDISLGQKRQSKAGERTVPLESVEASGTSTEVCSVARLGTAEGTSVFGRLGDQAQAQEDNKSEVLGRAPTEQQIPRAVAPREKQEEAVGAPTRDSVPNSEVAAPAAAAAAAIDSVVQVLEQLRNNAAGGNGGAVTEPLAGTALLLQIQSSLALATEALARMGVDVSALTSLAVAPRLQTPNTHSEWTPSASHKRPRVEASPSTPTRMAAAGAAIECVPTPVLHPGPPVARPAVEAAAVEDSGAAIGSGPGERFQQLGKRLSDASSEAAGLGASQSQPRLVQLQQPSVMVSLNAAVTQGVDVAAVEERTSWEARLEAIVDSEREAAALVIAAVERERDGLQQRVGELEAALASLKAERDGLVLRLEVAEVACTQAQDARGEAEAEREAMAAKLLIVAERDTLAEALTVERLEKAVLAETLSSARVECEDLRRRYTERFSALSSELEAMRDSLVALQGEHDELLLCLGQESMKVALLTDALRDAGGDPEPLIERIETEYAIVELARTGCGDYDVEHQDAATGGEQLESLLDDAGKGWEGADLQL